VRQEQESWLAGFIRGGGPAAARARRHFLSANTRLVTGVARSFEGRGLPLDELVRAGNDGLLRAAELYDWRRGRDFAPFAAPWIRQSILHALETNRARSWHRA
jgi:RNA polymerase sigma factor (sigma-70 family)